MDVSRSSHVLHKICIKLKQSSESIVIIVKGIIKVKVYISYNKELPLINGSENKSFLGEALCNTEYGKWDLEKWHPEKMAKWEVGNNGTIVLTTHSLGWHLVSPREAGSRRYLVTCVVAERII